MLWGASTRSSWKTPSRPLTRGLEHRGGVTAQAPPTQLSTGATHPHLFLHLLEGITEDIPPEQGQDGTSRGQQEGQQVSLEPERDVLAVLALKARSHVAAGEVQGEVAGATLVRRAWGTGVSWASGSSISPVPSDPGHHSQMPVGLQSKPGSVWAGLALISASGASWVRVSRAQVETWGQPQDCPLSLILLCHAGSPHLAVRELPLLP